MKETIYAIASKYYQTKKWIGDKYWLIKFKTLCTYYKGGKNIPVDILTKWCPIEVNPMDAAVIGAAEHLYALLQLIGIKIEDEYVMLVLAAFMRGDTLSLRQAKMARRVFLSTYPAKQYFRYMYIYGNTRRIKYVLSSPENMDALRELLTRQNKHLTMSIIV